MGQISSKLRSVAGGGLAFQCPGCGERHIVYVGAGPGPRWSYNGNPDKPTFSPSVLVTSGHYMHGHADNVCWCKYNAQHPADPAPFECTCCHSFVIDGRIQFCPDSTHALAGQTVDLPDWPDRSGVA